MKTSVRGGCLCAIAILVMAVAVPAGHGARADEPPSVAVVPNIGVIDDNIPELPSYDRAEFSPDGQIVALVDYTLGVKVWDVTTSRLLRTLQHETFFLDAKFTNDGKLLVTSHKDGAINLWDLQSDKPVATLRDKDSKDLKEGEDITSYAVWKLLLHPGSELLVAADQIGNVSVWNIKERRRVARLATSGYEDPAFGVSPAVFSTDLTNVVIETTNGRKAIDLKTGRPVAAPKNAPAVAAFNFPGELDSLDYVKEGECKIDALAYVHPKNGPKPLIIDRPPVCQVSDDDQGLYAPIVHVHRSQQEILIGRRGQSAFKIWDRTKREVVRTYDVADVSISADLIGVSPDLSQGIINSKGSFTLIDFASGQAVAQFKSHGIPAWDIIESPAGQRILISDSKYEQGARAFRVWQLDRLGPGETFTIGEHELVRAVSATGTLAVTIDNHPDRHGRANEVRLVRLAPSQEEQRIKIATEKAGMTVGIGNASLSPDERLILVEAGLYEKEASNEEEFYDLTEQVLHLVDTVSGNVTHTLKSRRQRSEDSHIICLAFSPDSTLAAAGYGDGTADLWDTATGEFLRTLTPKDEYPSQLHSLAFSHDGKRLIAGTRDSLVYSWNAETGEFLGLLSVDSRAGHTTIYTVDTSRDGKLVAAGIFERSRSSGDVGAERAIKVWEAATGKLVYSLDGHEGGVGAVMFTSNDRMIVSASYDGTIRYWDRQTGKWLATIATAEGDRWMTITEAGFFAGSADSADLINVVRGLAPYSVTQFHDHLYRPDLVEELLKGDPEGKYEDAALNLNLAKVLDSGSAPELELLDQKTEQVGGAVRLTVRINSTGGGIGEKLIWRVNGVTQGNPEPAEFKGLAEDPLASATVTETLIVDAGQPNVVEVTAYNGAGLLATIPLSITVDAFGVTTTERPRMHVLAIGVDDYRMKDYRLKYAVKDAKRFAEAMKAVGRNLFQSVEVTPLHNEQVTRESIKKAFAEIRGAAKPIDVFVLFLGGHGKSVGGRYYYYPQNLDFAAGQSYADGIGQDEWQQWLASVPAQKTLLVLDTCESGAAGALIRGADSVRKTAMDQLQYATGHNLIAAAGSTQSAIEGYQGHGVLTFALLDALTLKDGASPEEKVKVATLAHHVSETVPAITRSVWGVFQTPIHKLSGSDFPLGIKASATALKPSDEDIVPSEPTHFLRRPELARKKAEPDAESDLETLEEGLTVRVVKFTANGMALIARDGKKLGYVPADSVKALK